jgi:hypothetical protein
MHGPTFIFWANLTPFSLKGTVGAARFMIKPSALGRV